MSSTVLRLRRSATILGICVLVACCAAARAATEEDLSRMEQEIVKMAANPVKNLEYAIGDYQRAFLSMYEDGSGGKRLVQRLSQWQKDADLPVSAQFALLMAQIDLVEDKQHFPEPPQAAIDAAYEKLLKMDRKELGDIPLLRAMTYLHEKGQDDGTLAFANEFLRRKNPAGRANALYHRSIVLAKSENKADQDSAINGFREIIGGGKSGELLDGAMHGLGKLQIKHKDWAAAERTFFEYVATKDGRKHRAEAWFGLALARDRQGRVTGDRSAAMAYSRVWSKYTEEFHLSCPAMQRSIEIERDNGEKENALVLADSWLRELAKHKKNPDVIQHLPRTKAMRDALANDPDGGAQ